MALNQNGRIAVFATVGEALARTWELKVPLLVLGYLIALPWAVGSALGLFDGFRELAAATANDDAGQVWRSYPFGAMALILGGGLVLMVAFAIFWFRYLLLGRAGALRFGLAQFTGMCWRMTGYGVGIGLAALVVLFLSIILVSMVGGVLTLALGVREDTRFAVLFILGMLLTYPLPLAFALRFSLAFVGTALGRPAGLGRSWSETGGTAWRLTGAVVLATLPAGLIGYVVNFAAFAALGVNLLDPEAALAAYDYWWLSWIISPLMVLPLGLALAVIALAYRDLTGAASAAPAGDAEFAH